MRYYVIQGLEVNTENLFWSNTEGWIELSEADVFEGAFGVEPALNLPIGGKWVMLPNPQETF